MGLTTSAQGKNGGEQNSKVLGPRVLIIDDFEDCLISLEHLLLASGCRTETVLTGTDGLESFARFRPDVVLLDIVLPDMSGYEVARKIRQHPLGKSCLLIAISGFGGPSDRKKSSQAGFDYHEIKPLNLKRLRQYIDEKNA